MLQIINIQDEESLSYPLCLLRISGTPNGEKEGFVRNLNEDNENYCTYTVVNNSFNAFVFLKCGKNVIEVQCGNASTSKTIYYNPPSHSRSVRLLYITCLNEEKFQGPPEMIRDANEAVKRIQIGALLMQTFLAETLSSEGLGRKTFQLEMTKQGMPKVFIIQIPLTIEESHKFPEEKLWENIAIQILSSPLASRSCKYLAFFCGTRFMNPQKMKIENERQVLSLTKGHVSLGGGGLALVGTGALYAYASNINDIMKNLSSEKKIDTQALMDFSARRGTYGACYGTHLGSVLHELGHTFDLGHTADGIMSRGFEDFHLYFTVTHVNSGVTSNTQYKNLTKPSIPSSLIKNSMTFTTDFIRKKSVENISMVVEPLKDRMATSAVYSPSFSVRNYESSLKHYKSMNNINSPTSPCFEIFEHSCLSQNIKKVEFAPKSPNPSSESISFFKTPIMQFKINSSKSLSSSTLDANFANDNNKIIDSFVGKQIACRAFWARSNAVILAYHKWINGSPDGAAPELKGSVLRSNYGIRAVELRDSRMMAFHHWEYIEKNPPPIIHLPWAQISKWPNDSTIEVVAIDNDGGILKEKC
ncbi:putative zinc metalloproteinase [Armadillidium nasatum]|uniref:Putative zinc metalloproteinase n=1 Tax=Armadillidium nasatum TaxID=96803 RepID=A0A5N5TDL1_9CRUS|nr:putative zinc metalloproteinase [Armadillidium nasatum]